MSSISRFLEEFNGAEFLSLFISVAASLLCITLHELSHGMAAYRLGDNTARDMGRLTLNPLKHLDPLGLLMMVVFRVGWAKPVPVDMSQFENPKRDMAITALAGPASNFVTAFFALLIGRTLLGLGIAQGWVMLFLVRVALLSVMLGVFNLIPVSPLDGSKVLFSLLPNRAYLSILRWERYGMLLVFALLWFGLLDYPLGFLSVQTLNLLCKVSGFPMAQLMQML